MHNLAIALKLEGHDVTGSDDEIRDPSRATLKKHGLLLIKTAGTLTKLMTP
jgi:UDP-N-acetylmuramate: L-alanyl-gamma-D-glutamyl-meso-diaminopimelate ligase